jgi:hypothetical protein
MWVRAECCVDLLRPPGLPDISNNVGPVKLFLNTLLSFWLKEVFSFVCCCFFFFCIDDHDSFVIFRSASVRPKHLFDPYCDHDYSFKLPFQGAGCSIKWATLYSTPCPVSSCPAYEPNAGSCFPKPINKSLIASRGADIVMQSCGFCSRFSHPATALISIHVAS